MGDFNNYDDEDYGDVNDLHDTSDINREDSQYKEETSQNSKTKDTTLKDIVDMILYLGTVILVVLLIYQFVGQQVEVNGSSMEPSLSDENRLILEKISYRFDTPERFDIVVFRPYDDEKNLFYIKRIIGLPGETIQISGNKIYINDELLEEDYGKEPMEDSGAAEDGITLQEDEYFVLGDNRNRSTDSRYEVGNVDSDAIIGRAFAKIWPLSEMEILKHQ